MSHYPGHVRDAFLAWIEDGYPETATIEKNYEPHDIPADELLRLLLNCTDIMPSYACTDVAESINYVSRGTGNPQGMTYSQAANTLLVQRSSGDLAALSFLHLQFGIDDDWPAITGTGPLSAP